MRYLSADYIFPISSPQIKNGIIAVDDDGFVKDVLQPNTEYRIPNTEFYEGILCPGFINSHCHLELSYLKGKLSEKTGLAGFIGEIEAERRNFSEEDILKAIVSAEDEMLKNGIVAVGDICNSDFTFKQKEKGKLKYHTFIEALGFHPDRADSAFEKCLELYHKLALTGPSSAQSNAANLSARANSASVTPHAPYSASEKLLKKINDFACENNSIISIHNQECEEENKMFLEGKGKILERLKSFRIDVSHWKATEKNSFQSIFPHLPKKNKILFVHNTFTSQKDIEWLKLEIADCRLQIYFCFCPNANLYIENRLPDFQMFIDEGCKITVGTDSLASNWSLSVLDELKTISANSQEIPLQTLLAWATKNGAEFFGWEKELGTLEKGKKPGINRIKNVDLRNQRLTKDSEVEKII